MKKQLLLLLVLISVSLFAQVPQSEKDALIALYNAINGSNWTNNTNWNTTQPVSTWYGVTVENVSGTDHVTQIDLQNNNLQGVLPPEIGDFPELTILWLYNSPDITGGIPPEIGNLTNLESLAFVWNFNMTGSIPNSITNLVNLESLYLSYNHFSGTIPDLTSLPLSTLWIDNNDFQFGDFENEFTSYSTISNFLYTPQNQLYTVRSRDTNIGGDISITSTINGANNTYQWYKVTSEYMSYADSDSLLLTGETNATLTLTNVQSTDLGYYYCKVSNTVVTGLDLKQEFFSINEGVPQIEKDALIALYNATDGPNWNDNANWNTSESLATWSGVTVENGHVTKLQLYNNNLTGTLPTELQNLPELYRLSISYNNLSGAIPDLTGLSNLTQFYIGMNYFQFADFENEVASYIANVSSFWYNSMKKIDTEIDYDITIGNDYTFTMSAVSGTGVTYQWYKNDEIIPGETNLTYTITNTQTTDAANYTCKASSTLVPDLQIERNTIHIYDIILPADKNALIMLYYATDGTNWTDNTNWNTSAPIHDWYGVEVEGSRVKSITLDDNNLVGALPTQIGDLDYLQILRLRSNTISGTIPLEIGNLVELTTFDIDNNQFTGIIPTEIGNLVKITAFEINNNQFTGIIPAEIGNLTKLEYFAIYDNQLSGNIPTEIGNLVELKYFYIGNNLLTGELPIELENLTKMVAIYASNNQFTGVQNIFTSMPNLLSLSIDYNSQLIGSIDLSNNSQITNLFIGNTLLDFVDFRNGNNQNTPYFYAQNTPNLTCILVDDAAWSTTNWTNIDTTTHFFETQQECDDFNSQTTYVPDDNFEQALIDLGYDDILDDYVLTNNINTVTTLDITNQGITDLTGIADFISLTSLSCYQNNLTSIDVSNLSQLQSLSCNQNSITSLNVSQNTLLTYLNCYGNNLTNLDVSLNTNLNYISCLDNNISSLDLSNNNQLTQIYVYQNNLSSLNINNGNNGIITNFIATSNPNLYCIQVDDYISANLANGNYASWQADSQVTFSNSNCASQTNIPDNNFEQALIDLGYDRALDDYIPTSNINQITSLIIENKNIYDITGVEDFVNLYQLSCGYNPLGTIDISNNTNLTFFNCSQTDLNSINISSLVNLQNFYCKNNNLSNLDLSQNSNLKVLYCDHNQLNNLILSQNNLLEVFNCSDNNLTSLDVSNNLNLLDARGENNNLTSLDFSQNSLITKIDFYNNQLSFLDVRNGNNQIITSFYNVNNPNLTCIYVDDAAWSATNWTNVDPTSTFVETEADCTALATTELDIQNNLSVYPNPTTGIVQIENNTDNIINKIVVTNMLGQEVNVFENNINYIDISHLPNAVYFINIFIEDNNTVTYKIVKK